jgi:parallel beta-helix repeat protein
LQAKIDAAPSGGTVVAAPCIYREQITINKPIHLVGQPGSEIRGSDVWREWTYRKGYWRSNYRVPKFLQSEASCMPNTSLCKWPEQVFIDGKPLQQVAPKPKSGQFAISAKKRRVLLKDDPRGHLVEVTVRPHWVLGRQFVNDVEIEGFTMKHAANDSRSGALMNRMSFTEGGGARWIVHDNVLTDAHGAIISLAQAPKQQIIDNEIARGGRIGINSAGQGTVIRGNEIYDNNTEKFAYNGLYGIGVTGGAKFAANVQDVVFESNEVHDNYGIGIHFDINCRNNTVSNNRIYDNARKGIVSELCVGTQIFGNVIYDNGWATPENLAGTGITVSNSSDVEVRNNTLAWDAGGILVKNDNRDGTEYDLTHDVRVHHNTILQSDRPDPMNNPALAWVQSWTDTLFDPANNNWGAYNSYWYPDSEGSSARYWWKKNQYVSLSDFNATPGEEDGRYLTQDEKDAVVNDENIPALPEP